MYEMKDFMVTTDEVITLLKEMELKCIVEESTAAGSATAEQHAHSNHPPMPEPPLVARSARLIAQSAVVTHDDVVKTTSA